MTRDKKYPIGVTMTPKGKALIAAIKAGLCPKTEDGYDVTSFEKFWANIESETESKIYMKERQLNNKRLSIIGIVTGLLGACFAIIALIMRISR